MKRTLRMLGGFLVGVANGLLGVGGDMAIVPMLRKSGLPIVKGHAASIAVILPTCVLGAELYLFHGSVTVGRPLPYLPWVLTGSAIGSWAPPRLNRTLLYRLFDMLML